MEPGAADRSPEPAALRTLGASAQRTTMEYCSASDLACWTALCCLVSSYPGSTASQFAQPASICITGCYRWSRRFKWHGVPTTLSASPTTDTSASHPERRCKSRPVMAHGLPAGHPSCMAQHMRCDMAIDRSATQRELGHLPPHARHDVSSQKQSAVSSQQELLRTLARMGTRVSVCAGRGSFAARIFR
eukprot:COSAG03_NODE_1644_length_3724_cov_1.777103_4_plen_189_part_00